MRVVLIINPFATSTTESSRDLLINTLGALGDVRVELTTHRGHAEEIAAAARADGVDLVIAHGGDGTVCEAVNGLLTGESTNPQPPLAVIPGGNANVFARASGIRANPTEAVAQLVDLIARGTTRQVTLGEVSLDGAPPRLFLFTTGFGIDAKVVKSLEAQRRKGKKATVMRYLRTTIRQFVAHRSDEPKLTVLAPDRPPVTDVYFAFISNASPWTYFKSRPIVTNPGTSFDTALGLFAVRSMGIVRNSLLGVRLLTPRPNPKGSHLVRDDNVEWVEVSASEPIEVESDGDYLGTFQRGRFTYRDKALLLVSPPTT